MTYYQNNILKEHALFEKQFKFLKKHFFSRIEWARLKLSFKKLFLFQNIIKALRLRHYVDDKIQILKNKIRKIANFSTPTNKTEVRSFLETIKIIHRWISNFSEISCSLNKLTEKVDWKWNAPKQLTFEILRVKCCITFMMFEYDYFLPTHFYTDASLFEKRLMITQFQPQNNKLVKVPILYDSITLKLFEQKYYTYKREFYALIKFMIKYDYFCKHSRHRTVAHTDHKPLVEFLKTDCYESIYEHWADKLHRLNLEIAYISKRRNRIADGLSKTLFLDEECDSISEIKKALTAFEKKESA